MGTQQPHNLLFYVIIMKRKIKCVNCGKIFTQIYPSLDWCPDCLDEDDCGMSSC
jgi:rRNA maturation endonuclease Nob1